MRVVLRVLGVCLALGAPPLWAADLLTVLELAKANDPVFQSNALTYRAEQELPKAARGALLPSISANAARTRSREEQSGNASFLSQGSATFNRNEYGVTLTQPVYNRDKSLSYTQARLRLDAAALDFDRAHQDLIIRVATRYFAVLAAQDNLTLAQAERKAVSRQLELADERLQVGLGTTTDLYDAQARFRLAEAQEISAQNLLDDANQALAELVGNVPAALDPLKADAPLPKPEPDLMQSWVARARDGNLTLGISEINERVAKREMERQRAGRMPMVDLVLSHGSADTDGSISGPGFDSEGTDAKLQVTLPIFQGGAISARARAALYRYQAAQKDTESARRTAERNARSAFLDVTSSIRQVQALEQAVVASESALEAKQEGFDAGLNTNLDVLDAQRDLFRAKRDYLGARYDYVLKWLQLQQVVGDLRQNDLEQVNRWLL